MTDLTDALPLPTAAPRPPAHRRAPWIAEARALGKLALPLAVTQLAQMAVLTTDIIMLGRLGRTALASAAIGNTVFYFAWLFGLGPMSALAPMIAQALGARRSGARISDPGAHALGEVRRIARMGLWAVLIMAPPLMIFLLFARPILLAAHQEPLLAQGAGQFVAMLAIGLPFSLAYQGLRNVASALGHARAALAVMAATILFNVLGDYTLIFGHFGAPRLGIVGAGMATSASMAFSALIMATVIRFTPTLHRYRILRRFHQPAWKKLKEIFHLGAPIGVTILFEAMMFNAMTLVMGTFGAEALAAHQVALNFASITFMGPQGIGMAAAIRVGLAAGAEDYAGVRRAGYAAMAAASALIGVCGIIMALFGANIASLYISGRSAQDLAVIALAASFLKVAAAFQVFDAVQVVGAMSLRGLKDARAPMLLAGASYWLAGAPMCIFLGVGLHMRGLGVWLGLAFGLGVAAAAMSLRFRYLSRDA
jgi:MATE family multidrug resistance protein